MDPLNPSYKMLGSTVEDPPLLKFSGRNSLDVSDIEGAASRPSVPLRSQYGDTMRIEDTFKSRRHAAALAEVRARAFGLAAPAEETLRKAGGTPRLEGPQRSDRCTDPLNPRYRVRLPKDSPGTSLCAAWAEEQRYMGATIPVESCEIGHILGSVPHAGHRDNGEPFMSLETRDVVGANSMRRVGAMPYSIYGPSGKRREWNAILDTRDIKGAQADTLARHPKVTSLNSARSPADAEPMSARGRLLRSCPEKI